MDLTPELLRTVEFNDARKGGYDHDEVDEFLDRAAADLARQHDKVRELETRISEAERRAAEAEASAKDNSDSDETLRRTLVLAQRTADAAIKEAEDDAARIVAEARQRADGMIASAEEQVRRDVGATRDRLQVEIRELEGRRSELHGRINELSGHLDAERDRVATQLEQLRESLRSDSMAFAPVPGGADEPSVVDSTTPTESDPEPAVDAAPSDIDLSDDDATADPGVVADAPEPVDEPGGEDLSDLPPPPEDWSSSADDEGGPPTEATPVVDLGSDVGSSHLDELRRAVGTGPDEQEEEDDAAMAAFFDQDDDAEPSRRFGRRR